MIKNASRERETQELQRLGEKSRNEIDTREENMRWTRERIRERLNEETMHE